MSSSKPKSYVNTSEPMIVESKRVVLVRYLLGFGVFTLLAVAGILLDNRGIKILLINQTQSLMLGWKKIPAIIRNPIGIDINRS